MPIETGAEDNGARQGVIIIQPECQRTTFNFDFSMPIQDTFTLARDPNRFPVIDSVSNTFVADATAAFPNVAHLILRRYDMALLALLHLNSHDLRLLDDARTRNTAQWQSQYREAWPSVSTIWAEDPSLLYALGFSRRVSSISIPMRRHLQEDYIGQVLADTSPSFLELRVEMDNFWYNPTDLELYFGPSVLRLTLLLYTHAVTDKSCVSYMLECLGAMLPALTSLTHLLVRFAPTPKQPGSAVDTDWVHASPSTKTHIVHGAIQEYLRILAGTGTSLRWIGYEVHGWGIKSWDISRAGSGSEEAARRLKGLKMVEMSESESLAVLGREGMNEFRDVKPTLVLL